MTRFVNILNIYVEIILIFIHTSHKYTSRYILIFDNACDKIVNNAYYVSALARLTLEKDSHLEELSLCYNNYFPRPFSQSASIKETRMNSRLLKGYIMVILSAVIYGCMPLMAKYIYADGSNAMTLVFLRNLLAVPTLAIMAYGKDKTLKIFPKRIPYISLLALLGCCLTPLLLFSSYVYIPSGTSTVLHFVYPALVVVGGIIIGERLKATSIISVVLCIVGISMFYDTGAHIDVKGVILAILSGVVFATYVLMLTRYKHRGEVGERFTLYIALASGVIMLIFCIASGSLALPETILGWVLCFVFAQTVTAIAVVLFQKGTFAIGGERASILSTLEPITSVIIGTLIFSEPMTLRTVVGTLLVLSASVVITVRGKE